MVNSAAAFTRAQFRRGKLLPPALPRDYVPRPSLVALLEQAQQRPLTLLSAPAGYGKTTLLSAWAATKRGPLAWLSLDEQDSHLPTFVRALVSAIQTACPNAGNSTLDLLGLPELPPVRAIADALGNEIEELRSDLTIVLDDYHLIEDDAVHALVARLIQYLAPPSGLVLATRHDPPLPLATLRARDQVQEVRFEALRFRRAEARTFLTNALASGPTEETLDALVKWSEGWPAGLRLAALALKAHLDSATNWPAMTSLGATFAYEFLLSQVFARQRPEMQQALLSTAICDRFNAPLCDAILERCESSGALLEEIERTGLFLVHPDVDTTWYRYHHLFRSALLHHLRSEVDAETVKAWHRRASAWFAERGLVEEAIPHALAAGKPLEAARVVEAHVPAALATENWPPLEAWLRLLPAELVAERPGLLLARAWTYETRLKFDRLPPLLTSIEAQLGQLKSSEDDPPAHVLRAEADVLWASSALMHGDAHACQVHAQRALDHLPPDRPFARGYAALRYGQAVQLSGDSARAIQFLNAARLGADGSRPVFEARVLTGIISSGLAAGNLQLVDQTSRELVSLAAENHLQMSRPYGHYGLARVAYEWNRPAEARDQCLAVLAMRHQAHPRMVTDSTLLLALAEQALGDPVAARQRVEELLDSAAQAEDSRRVTLARAFGARLALLQADRTAALEWLRTAPGRGPIALPHDLEDLEVTRAQVMLVAGGRLAREQAAALLAGLASTCAARHDIARLIQTLALQALAYQSQGLNSHAQSVLQHAVDLAERGNFIRTFLDLGPKLARLLGEVSHQGSMGEYVERLLAAFAAGAPGSSASTTTANTREEAITQLSAREREVLQLLADRLSNKEIATALRISWQTVARHTANLYQKLGVSARSDAVARSRALGLLPPR